MTMPFDTYTQSLKKLVDALNSYNLPLVRESLEEGADIAYGNYYPVKLAALKGDWNTILTLLKHSGNALNVCDIVHDYWSASLLLGDTSDLISQLEIRLD